MIVERQKFLATAVHFGSYSHASLVKALCVPGMLGEAMLSMLLSWPASWHPAAFTLDDWRVIAFPFFSLPFWWFAGLGLEGLFRVRRLRWYSLIPGTLLALLCLVLCVGIHMADSENPKSEQAEILWAYWGLGLWTVLLAAYPVSWFRNRKFRVTA